MMEECELCDARARMYCESDRARLCWECDEKVHSANFIVARHTRTLLCGVCQGPTPWRASGRVVGSTASICHGCAQNGDLVGGIGRAIDVSDEEMESSTEDTGRDDDHDYDDEDDDDDEDDEDGENQVVPWGSTASTLPPPPPAPAASSSSSSDGWSRGELFGRFERNRMYQDDEISGSYGQSSSEDSKTEKERIVNCPIRSNRGGFGRSSADHHFPRHRR
ncbi:hypothetical protein Sjap_025442 [Stephania japonica]|uniref:B box-type domain-containing protein n=1 Tax=Stephania japonica TaxID=461633 RepID=A0AAP0E1T1_9MAGN